MSEPELVTRWSFLPDGDTSRPMRIRGVVQDTTDASGEAYPRTFYCAERAMTLPIKLVHESVEACVASVRAHFAARRADIDATFQRAESQYKEESMALDRIENALRNTLEEENSR